MMVGSRRAEEVVDPNIEARPSTRALKRALLAALRCVDPDSEKRPKMGQVVRMLESDDPVAREVCALIFFFFTLTVQYLGTFFFFVYYAILQTPRPLWHHRERVMKFISSTPL